MRLPRAVKARVCSQVLVTLKSGETFAGVLFEADSGSVVLRNASAVGAGENRADLPLDGEILLLLPDVLYIQRP